MRERAEELGGRVAVETTPGEGTTVVAEIPAAASDTAVALVSHPAPDPVGLAPSQPGELPAEVVR